MPRYRWDQLLVLAWRTYLPLVLAGVFFITAIFLVNLNCEELNVSLLCNVIYFRKQKAYNIKYVVSFLITIFILNWLLFQNPLIILLFLILIAFIPSLTLISYFKFKMLPENKIVFRNILEILKYYGVLDLLFQWYYICNTYLTVTKFKIIMTFFVIFNIIYIITARYCFYLKINHVEIPLYFVVISAFLSIAMLLRILTSFVFNIVPYLVNTGAINLVQGFEPEMPPAGHSSHSARTGWFNTNHHHHYYPPEIPRSRWVRAGGIFVAVGGLGTSLYACYEYHESNVNTRKGLEIQQKALEAQQEANILAKKTLEAQHMNNHEMAVQNDLEAYSQELLTREQLCNRDTRFCLKSNAKLLADRMEASKKAGFPGIKVSSDK